MKLYMFRSETKNELRAFCADVAGSRLPDQYGPWRATGVVASGRAPPHNLPRDEIEKSIGSQGFQLWRPKAT